MTIENLDKVKKQIEFYFSDSNFRVDKFLRTEALKNDGWIDIQTILTFKKMKEYNTTLEMVKTAMNGSTLVEINDDKIKKIESEKYKEYIMKEEHSSSFAVVKGFDIHMSFEEIEIFLSEFVKPRLIRMRKDRERKFNGTVFVELGSEEEINEFLKLKIKKPILKNEVSLPEKNEDSVTKHDDDIKKEKIDSQKETKEEALVEDSLSEDAILKNKGTGKREREDAGEDCDRIKRVKTEANDFLVLIKMNDYLKEVPSKPTESEKLIKSMEGKFYKFEAEGSIDIKTVKRIIPGVAFVDTQKNTLRFKHVPEFETKDFESEDIKIKVTKLNKTESDEYTSGLNLKPKPVKKGRRRRN
ncbi:La domain-containing protein [Hamiltosporidium tvaerminnensis]|uniref:La domain-containing protein n=2 Tax=Hamiltosporidium tvaerminnensis TaxID=1176355 RepID=A0A4Q9LY33_9MICR|nr:hypothetical protein LUQ84_000951 [Hamiltosporidium tvaerminnensis]TBU13217.1 La domain-containing protein [Hamiltosporidium tvaerminnensis]